MASEEEGGGCARVGKGVVGLPGEWNAEGAQRLGEGLVSPKATAGEFGDTDEAEARHRNAVVRAHRKERTPIEGGAEGDDGAIRKEERPQSGPDLRPRGRAGEFGRCEAVNTSEANGAGNGDQRVERGGLGTGLVHRARPDRAQLPGRSG